MARPLGNITFEQCAAAYQLCGSCKAAAKHLGISAQNVSYYLRGTGVIEHKPWTPEFSLQGVSGRDPLLAALRREHGGTK